MTRDGSRKVTILTYELRGLPPAGGIGTATTHLALALARAGHAVEILLGWQRPDSLDPHWQQVYARAGIGVRAATPSGERTDSWHFGMMRNVELALLDQPPEIVIAHEFNAPAYSALRLRQAGLAFENCVFVTFCHGNRRYVADASRRPYAGDLQTLLSVGMLERATVELADAVVSPSAYLVEWMRTEGWRLPDTTQVIPYITGSGAAGVVPERARHGEHVDRLVFFGRLDEKKGLEPFADALNALEPELLAQVELEFLGKPTATWSVARVARLLSPRTQDALRGVSYRTTLDQHEALARLKRAGTLAVMPSLFDNSPNTVYECLEHGVPFIASDVGGIAELIAPPDRGRVLFEPDADDLAAALRRALHEGSQPARPAFDADTSLRRWTDLLALQPKSTSAGATGHGRQDVDIIVTDRRSQQPVEEARTAALSDTSSPFVLLLDAEDEPDGDLVETLLGAQASSGADVVTCALRLPESLHFFLGEPGGLGVLANHYGNVALVRRALLSHEDARRPAEHDPDWPLLARLAASGARILSVPRPLVSRRVAPGTIEEHPGDALLAVQELERALPPAASALARLAAGLAATSARTRERRSTASRWRRRARSFARKVPSARPASPR
jgi:glycosyltransferase involved in cell wall biosynthesis